MTLPLLSSWTVWGILIITLMMTIHTTEAALGDNCTVVADCGYDGATCDGGQCGCDTAGGYREENNQCLPNVPAVNLTGPSSIVFGQDAVYTASVTSDPVATDIVWQKVSGGATSNITIDGTNTIQTGTLTAGSVTLNLTIKSVKFDDEATYQVMVLNSVGHNTSNQLALDVTGESPTVSVSGPSQSGAGASVTIVCSATVDTSVSPAITAIQWTKDNTAIDIAGSNGKYTGGSVTTPSLTITSITTTDKGDYKCTATNPVGSTTSTSAVTLALPTVSITGASSVLYGNTVTFTGTVNSNLALTDQKWQKVLENGNVMDIDISGEKYAGSSLASPNSKLQIKNTNFTDEAKYQLFASNGVGPATSNHVSLDITGESPTVTISGGSTVMFGSDIMFTGTVTSSPVQTSVVWQRSDGSSEENLDISKQKYLGSSITGNSPKLVIKDANFTDMAIYHLTVTNLVGKKTSNGINLTVTGEKPTITINSPSNIVSVVYGKTATLTATVTTTPDSPSAGNGAWQKQMSGVFTNIDIADEKYKDSKNDISGPTLKINSAVYTDEGSYRFTTSNLVGTTVSTPRTLDVTGKPNKIARVKRAATSVSPISSTSSTSNDPNITMDTPTANKSKPEVSISADPSNSIQFGTTLRITAMVTANPPANSARWQRKPLDGEWSNINVSDYTYDGSSDTPGALLLVISNITYNEENVTFQCVVGNAEGETTSNNITIDVTGNLLRVSVPSGTVQLPYDTTLTPALMATVTAGVNTQPAQEVRWRKITSGSEDIIDINAFKYSGSTNALTNPQLVINDAVFGDEAEYQCQARNAEGWGSSDKVIVNVTGGALTVTIGPDVTGKIGENVTILCSFTGPEISYITWKMGADDLSIDGTKYTGSTTSSPSLIINNLVMQDAGQYLCTASNPGGTYSSPRRAALTVINRQFQDSCDASLPCDDSKKLECSQSGYCVCKGTFYHNNGLCYSRDRLKVTITSHSSTTSAFTVTWNPPSNDVNLVSGYTVRWRIHNQAESNEQSQTVDKSLSSHTVSTGLIPGQLYIVTVTSDVTLTNPTSSIQVRSDLEYIRIVPLRPGSILDSSDFAADKLMLSWTAPISNTVVTKYEVTIDGTTQSTVGSNANVQFTKQLIPGTTYTVSIVTVSGQNINDDEEKKSVAYTEDIRTTPKKPGAPKGVTCPTEPKDKSLEISWTATTAPNGRIKRYIITVRQNGIVTKTVNTLINVTTFDVLGLLEERIYTFTVQTVNDAVNSTSDESTPARTCKTKAGLSTPPTALTIGTPGSRGFPVSFSIPTDVKGKLAGYRILIKDGSKCWQQIKIICNTCSEFTSMFQGCTSYKTQQVLNIAVTQNYNVTDLHPYINYTVEVAAINGAGVGNSAEKTIMTEEEIPKQPSITNVTSKSDKAVELTWTLAPPSPGNVTYTVTVMEENDNMSNLFIPKKEIQYNGFEQTVKVIDGLEEYWRYKFIVRAATIKGSKMSDELAITRTKQGVPGKVRDLRVIRKPNTYRAALVQWKVPSLRDQNGILVNYKFIFKNDSGSADKVVPVNTNEQFVTQEEIVVVPEITYSVEIYAINSEGTNGENENFTYTAAAGPPPHTPDIEIVQTTPGQHSPSQTTIEIGVNTDFFTNKQNGEPVYFGIAACASCGDANFAGNGQQEYKNLPDWYAAKSQGFPLYRVTNESYMQEVKSTASGRRKRSTDEPFVIGEDNTCETQGANAYCNGPLSPGLSYTVIIFVCTNGGCTKSGDIGPFATLAVPDETSPIGGIVGGVVAAVVAVGVVAVAMFIVKRRRGRNPEHKYQKNIEEKGEDLSETPLKNIPRKRPIKLKDLAEKVADKHKDSNLYFAREYEDLKTLSPKHPTETSELDNNKLKNRYVNILPFDHSRVKLLLTEDDDPSTDFINANYLPGYKSEREYIATQGPIPGTIDDFWRMIWEQNVSIIVMLTLCKEDGRVKCEMYWPENMKEPKQYGDLVVETVSCSTVNFYDFRIFKMKLGDSTRTLKHFHFLQWKDFSANVQNDVMIDFIRNVRNHIRPPDMNGPVVVHCSAGVGRTGTYCALDHLFQVIDDHDLDYSIDIFDLVLNLREQRMFMVQTEQQYVFIHDCVRDYVEKKRKEMQGELLYENVNQAFVSDEPAEESLYQNYSNQRTDL